jgi:hypothetical protein
MGGPPTDLKSMPKLDSGLDQGKEWDLKKTSTKKSRTIVY